MIIVSIDPSGNWSEGKGTTGIAVFKDSKLDSVKTIKAIFFADAESYWNEVAFHASKYVVRSQIDVVVCEAFKLQPNKAAAQSWSSMETPMLIGHLRMQAWQHKQKFVLQDPSCKARVPDELLVKMGVLEKRGNRHYALGRQTNDHMRDAIRHGVYYHLYGRKRE